MEIQSTVPSVLDKKQSIDRPSAALSTLYGGLILLIFGLRIVVISRAGSITPYMDEWGSDLTRLAIPFVNGRLRAADLFLYCNEHLIFFTKLLTILSVWTVGYYDPIAKMVFNAGICTLAFTLCLHLLTKCLKGSWRVFAIALAGIFMAVPFGLENILMGFNVHFYLIILFAVCGLWFLAQKRAWSIGWMFGLILSFCSFLCMASGALTFAAGAGVSILQIMCRQRAGKREIFGVLTLVAITAGLIATVPPNHPADPIHAHSLGQFLFAFAFRIASWPGRTFLGPLIYLPALAFLWRTLCDRVPIADARWFNIAVLGWVATQYAALAYGRAGSLLPSRYLDTAQLGVAASIVAAAWLAGRTGGVTRPFFRLALMTWVAMLAIGTILQAKHDISTRLEPQRRQGASWTLQVQTYYRTNDFRILVGKTYPAIAYTDPAEFRGMLDAKDMKRILPPQLRGSPLPSTKVEAVKVVILSNGWAMVLLGFVLTIFGAMAGSSRDYTTQLPKPLLASDPKSQPQTL